VSGNNITKKKYHIDTTALHFPKKGMEVSTYLKDGMIEDWDMFEQVSGVDFTNILRATFMQMDPKNAKRHSLTEFFVLFGIFACKSFV